MADNGTTSSDADEERRNAKYCSYIRPRLQDLACNCSVEGLKYVADSQQRVARRAVWGLLLFISVGVMLYQISGQITQYFDYPTRVDVRTIYSESIEFPSVTICNENRYPMSRLAQYGLTNDFAMIYEPWNFNTTSSSSINWSLINSTIAGTGLSYSAFYTGLSQNVSELVILCKYESTDCGHHNFTEIFTDAGLCHTFNPAGVNARLARSGTVNGLTLFLYVGQSDYVTVQDYTAGFRVVLHEANDFPYVEEHAFKISAGFFTVAKLSMIQSNYLPPPHGNCTTSNTLTYFSTYTLYNCHIECLVKYIINTCGCAHFAFPYISETVCTPEQDYNCVKNAIDNFRDLNIVSTCNCIEPCSVITYKESISSAIISEYLADYFQNNTGGSIVAANINTDYAGISLYFPKVSYTLVTTSASYTTNTLFCDFGGALGLLLGSTMLTVVEFVDFLIWMCVDHRAGTKKVSYS